MDLSEQDILHRLSVTRLPTIPQILFKLLELCQSNEVNTFELAKLIEQVPTIANKVLSIANSAAFQRNRQKIRLEQCLISLGTDMIRMLIINDSIFQNFNNFSTFKKLDLRDFWRHSLTTGLIARNIAKKWNYQNIDEAYLAGLLHDIGRVALLVAAPPESAQKYASIFHLGDKDYLLPEETQTLRINHAEAGAWLVKSWKMESVLVDSILYHHEPLENITSAHSLIRIIHLANRLADDLQTDMTPKELAIQHMLDPAEILELTLNVSETLHKTAELFGVDLSDIEKIPQPVIETFPPSGQQQLNREMHNIMHASEFRRYFSNQKNEIDLQNGIIQASLALFGLENAFLLWHQPDHDILTGIAADQSILHLIGFNIPMQSDGLIANITRKRQPFFLLSASNLTTALERTLAPFFKKSIVAIPIADDKQLYGVLIGGTTSWKLAKLEQEERLLKDFGAEIATAWALLKNSKEQIKQELDRAEEKYRTLSQNTAQEVNNPLSIIKNYLHILNKNLEKQDFSQNLITILNEEINRVSQIIHEMANPPLNQPAPIDINEVILDIGKIFRETQYAPVSIRITEHISSKPDEPAQVTCPLNLIKQVLVNLVKNAIETLPDGGEITIANKGKVIKEGRTYVGVSVSDTGTGISQEIQKSAFLKNRNPKDIEHYGLGLSIVYSLIAQIQGHIACHSDANGTVFDVLIPVSSPLT